MFTDILKKYMNIFIIILYVYILYSYDFKENIQLLLVITGIFIFIIYKNKGETRKEIIEGQEDMDETQVDETQVDETQVDETQDDETQVEETQVDETQVEETQVDETQNDELYIVEEERLSRLRGKIRELEEELNSLSDDGGGVDQNNPKINELINLYMELYPDININLPEIIDSNSSSLNVGGSELNLNLDLGNLDSINIPSDVIDNYDKNLLRDLKKRMSELEKRVRNLDDQEDVTVIKEKIFELELENDKWNNKEFEQNNGTNNSSGNLRQRKVRSFSDYKTTTPMGMYDGLCLDHLKKENINNLADEKDVSTFLGTTIPLNIKQSDNSKLTGPTVDGNDDSVKRMNMFETNKTSISCCEDSPYLSSNGCVCLTSDQEDYLINRGGNH